MVKILLFLLVFMDQQDPIASCKEEVEFAYERLKAIYDSGNRNIEIQYSLSATDRSGNTQEEKVSLLVKGEKSKVTSSRMTALQDRDILVGIDRTSNTILVSTPQAAPWENAQMKAMSKLFETLFPKLQLVSCENQCLDEKSKKLLRKIQFSFPESAKTVGQPKLLTYWMTEGSGEIKRIDMEYGPESDVRSVSFRLEVWNPDFSGQPFRGKALDQVFDSKGRQLPRFRQFRIVDVRKRELTK